MSALPDENQKLNYLYLEETTRGFDERMISNRKLREDSIANGKNVGEEDLKTKIEALLKSGDEEPFCEVLKTLSKDLQRLVQSRQQTNPVKMVPHHKITGTRRRAKKLVGQNADEGQEIELHCCKLKK